MSNADLVSTIAHILDPWAFNTKSYNATIARDDATDKATQIAEALAALDSRAGDAGEGPPDCMWRSGHDGAGPDPTRFFCEVIGPAPSCHVYRAVADTEGEARALAFGKADPSFSTASLTDAADAVGPVERALWAIADTALQDFRPGDPGKRVDSLIPTPEWKEMRKACDRRGVSISLFVRLAIRHYLTWLATYRSPAECEDFNDAATPAPAVDAKCSASPDHADILETIQNAADDWQKQGYPTALAEVRDMANVGRALMTAIADNAGCPPLKGWHPANCPSEIVSDLLNMLDDAQATNPLAVDAVPAGEVMKQQAHEWRRREVQAIGAAISTRSWHAVEQAYNSLRDKMDAAGCWHALAALSHGGGRK
ncbi:hypothetical protein [Sphingomonas yabuuchiae]|uniref:hypothetical protein n=1 Tax=Sphingomonas yabuuchiae TaxID=172044 RepID=UPI003D96D8A6